MGKDLYWADFGFWDVGTGAAVRDAEWAKKSIACGKRLAEAIPGCETTVEGNLVFKTESEISAGEALKVAQEFVRRFYGKEPETAERLAGSMEVRRQPRCLKCDTLAPFNATVCAVCRTKL